MAESGRHIRLLVAVILQLPWCVNMNLLGVDRAVLFIGGMIHKVLVVSGTARHVPPP
jgi:uncharacterized membrane protein YadS